MDTRIWIPTVEESLMSCECCLEEIPESSAWTPEGHEYVTHYCGIECCSLLMTHDPMAQRPGDGEEAHCLRLKNATPMVWCGAG